MSGLHFSLINKYVYIAYRSKDSDIMDLGVILSKASILQVIKLRSREGRLPKMMTVRGKLGLESGLLFPSPDSLQYEASFHGLKLKFG